MDSVRILAVAEIAAPYAMLESKLRPNQRFQRTVRFVAHR